VHFVGFIMEKIPDTSQIHIVNTQPEAQVTSKASLLQASNTRGQKIEPHRSIYFIFGSKVVAVAVDGWRVLISLQWHYKLTNSN
jgi:hypothetical protein